MLHISVLQWIMIHICIGGTISQTVVRGVVGQAVTLPCTYSVRHSSELYYMCWGRGNCPNSKCSNELLRTDGRRVTSRNSDRYTLKGHVTRRDVSLTIRNLNERDRGLYCCRIEVPGWFNDIKKTLNLQVDRATITVSTTAITTKSHMITATTMAPLTIIDTHPETSPVLRTTDPPSPTTSSGTSIPTMAPSSVATSIAFLTTTSSLVNVRPSPTTLQDKSTKHSCSPFTTETDTPITAATPFPATSLRSEETENVDDCTISTTITVSTTAITTKSHMITATTMAPLTIIDTHPETSPVPRTTDPPSPTTSSGTSIPTMAPSSVATSIAFLTTTSSLVNVRPSPTTLQDESTKHSCSPFTTETDTPITAATPFPATSLRSEETENVDDCTISTTASSRYITAVFHRIATHMTVLVTARITPPITPFSLSISASTPNMHIQTMTLSSLSIFIVFPTTAFLSVSFTQQSQEKCPEDGYIIPSDEMETSSAGLHQRKESYQTNGKITPVSDVLKKYYPVLIPCAIVLSVPFLVLGGLLVKRLMQWETNVYNSTQDAHLPLHSQNAPFSQKQQQMKCRKLRKYQLDKWKSLNKEEEPEPTEATEPTEIEGENGIFSL